MSPASSHRLCRTQHTWTTLVKSMAKSQPLRRSPHRPEKKQKWIYSSMKWKRMNEKATNLWVFQNSFPHICGRFSGVDWASCTIRDRRLRLCDRASGANSVVETCGRQGNADPRQLERVCLSGRFCTIARLWALPCCRCCPAGRCKRSQVCCCNRPHPGERWNSNQTSLCNLHRNYVG